jgi:hypothetical protein
MQNRQLETGGSKDGSGLVLGDWETQMYRQVGACACGLQLPPLAVMPSHKHNGSCYVVARVPRQEGQGFNLLCVGKESLPSLGAGDRR